jgi:hypothetical protein
MKPHYCVYSCPPLLCSAKGGRLIAFGASCYPARLMPNGCSCTHGYRSTFGMWLALWRQRGRKVTPHNSHTSYNCWTLRKAGLKTRTVQLVVLHYRAPSLSISLSHRQIRKRNEWRLQSGSPRMRWGVTSISHFTKLADSRLRGASLLSA